MAKSYMDKLFASLDAERLIKKDYIYYARILSRKNQNLGKLAIETDNMESDLTKLQAKYSSIKPGPAKDKAKGDIDALKAKLDSARAMVAKSEAEINMAIEAYNKAAFFDGVEDVNVTYEKGTVQYAAKRYVDAAETWLHLIDLGKNSENDYIQVGRAFYQAKEFDRADSVFNMMVSKYPDNLQAYLWMANIASAKDPDSELGLAKPKFQAVLQKAAVDSVKNVKEMYDALRYLGYEALQNKRYDEAKAYYYRMMNLSPDYVIKAHSSLSTLYISMGDYANAIAENNKILAIDPNNEAAKSSIQYIIQLQKSAVPKASPNEISGVITDSAGEPIPGASVRVKDTAAEAWTNAQGAYKFVMPEASEVLVVSAKGYKTIEIPVTKKRVYNVSLEK